MKTLIILNKLLHVCGITNHVYHFLARMDGGERGKYILLAGGGEALEKFRTLGCKVVIDRRFAHENRTVTGYLSAVFFLYRFIRRNGIDIVHSHHFYAASIAHKLKRFHAARTILSNHGLIPRKGVLRHFEADYIIAVNEHIVEYIVQNGIMEESKVFLIRAGVPALEVSKNRLENLRFIAAGRLVRDKGMDVFVEAAGLFKTQELNRGEFFIAGDGEERETLMDLSLNKKAAINFLGIIPDLNSRLADYDVFIMPTRSDAEGFPLAIVEAGMAGLLVVTSDFKGLREVFKPGADGLVFPVNDSRRLADLMLGIIREPARYIEMRSEFRKKVERLYSIERVSEQLTGLYSEIKKRPL